MAIASNGSNRTSVRELKTEDFGFARKRGRGWIGALVGSPTQKRRRTRAS